MTPPRSPKGPTSPSLDAPLDGRDPEPFAAGHEVAELVDAAHRVLARVRHGALATLTPEGAPFGTILPLAGDGTLAPLFALAASGEHARNLRHDDRASLLVLDPDAGPSPFDAIRVTLVGRARPVPSRPDGGQPAPRVRVREGEVLHRIEVERMRVVVGGRSQWILIH